MTTWVSI